MEIPYTVSARPDTGLYNAKVGIWLFLASEVMLFGGLFSSYVFLRIGADFAWPFHELHVLPGFINTMVLIASSVTVVAAWASLKARRYGWYQVNMIITILCSLAFMGIKSYEYVGKFKHYSVVLKDGTVIDGHPHHATAEHRGDDISYSEVNQITLSPAKSNLQFLTNRRIAEGGDRPFGEVPKDALVKVILPAISIPQAVAGSTTLPPVEIPSKEIDLSEDWYSDIQEQYWDLRKIRSKLAILKARIEAPNKQAADLRASGEGDFAKPVDFRKVEALLNDYRQLTISKKPEVESLELKVAQQERNSPYIIADTIKLQVAGEPLVFLVNEKHLQTNSPTEFSFRDDTLLEGKMTGDSIPFNIDTIDLRKVKKPEASLAWKYFPQLKEVYEKNREEKTREFLGKHPSHAGNYEQVGDWQHEVLRISLEEVLGDKEAEEYLENPAHTVEIERADKQFYTNFSPSKSPYYAIYFLMTGLHGLHVIGGAIVLSYFLFTGRKMYQRDPEHLANRVEVGGLFWHFVDLVWIFLFPVFYLM